MRLLVCGGRDFVDQARIFAALDLLHTRRKIEVLIHGDAPGADRIAARWAEWRAIPREPYPADWDRYKHAAGPIRNQYMLEKSRPDAVCAFPGGRGTADMVSRAQNANVPVWHPYPTKKKRRLSPWSVSGES